MSNVCKYCGGVLNSGDKFCKNCGSPVEEEVQMKQEPKQTTYVNNAQQNMNNGASAYKGKTNGAAIASFVCSLV